MMKLSGITSSIERSSDEMISASQPFKPELSLNTEKDYESITWEKVSGPGDIIFSSLDLLTQTSQQIRREHTKQKSQSFLKMVRVKKR